MTKKQNENQQEKGNKENVNENEETTQLKEHVENIQNQLKRALADYQNLEKRQSEERREWIKIANKQLLLRLLPVLDTLMLAGQHVEDEGLKLSIKQFMDTLKNEGVEKIQTEGKEFDPNLMEGIQTVDGDEGKVVTEIRPGFMLEGKVLRPAQVTVGKGK